MLRVVSGGRDGIRQQALESGITPGDLQLAFTHGRLLVSLTITMPYTVSTIGTTSALIRWKDGKISPPAVIFLTGASITGNVE